ncbi:MAG: TfoX/Sxy family protein [Gammaproteobacteria bacterium]|jgi:DNA transformation protein|nr:TfoX/Sxy family protein [Zhongshania sp.]MBU0537714.1 TfoX/Sxy family protein [Gammaproteobacteria bacterium]MBU1831352.1 TfoX/Sxy family protein [Gammaproteobacteria bacterium]
MASDTAFIDYLMDQLQWVGPVVGRKMFGGYGVFLEGLMFGLVIENTLYLKVDSNSKHDFEELGLPPFTYSRGPKEIALSYYQAPDEALDDTDMLLTWANRAYAAAMRCAADKVKKPASRV